MKRITAILFTILLTATAAWARPYGVDDIPNVHAADRTRFVSNPDGLLSPATVYSIDTMLYSLKESGKAQVVVIAVNSIGHEDPFDFLQRLVTSWGVGRSDTDDGLGVLLVVDQGAIQIETGYGLEGDLPDAICKRIIDQKMIPFFSNGDWDGGMMAGMTAICDILNGRPAGLTEESGDDNPLVLLLFVAIPILFIIVTTRFRARCPHCHSRKVVQTDNHVILRSRTKTVRDITYTCRKCGHSFTRRHIDHHGTGGMIIGGGMGGMGGGFSGGGGGGSFGGGSFGGGGAGGRF